MLHVHTYLVCASCFELALHHCYVAEVFDNLVVGDGVFALVAFGEDSHLQAVFRIAADVAFHSPVVFSEFTPYQRHVLAMGVLLKNCLPRKVLASGVLAMTSSPDVSLSMRCTRPSRGSLTS